MAHLTSRRSLRRRSGIIFISAGRYSPKLLSPRMHAICLGPAFTQAARWGNERRLFFCGQYTVQINAHIVQACTEKHGEKHDDGDDVYGGDLIRPQLHRSTDWQRWQRLKSRLFDATTAVRITPRAVLSNSLSLSRTH